MTRSPWFNARTEPPVNGDDDAVYEHRCLSHGSSTVWPTPARLNKWSIKNLGRYVCRNCQWRGLLREDGDGQ